MFWSLFLVPTAAGGWVERCRFAGVRQQTGPSQCLIGQWTHRPARTWTEASQQNCKWLKRRHDLYICTEIQSRFIELGAYSLLISYNLWTHSGMFRRPAPRRAPGCMKDLTGYPMSWPSTSDGLAGQMSLRERQNTTGQQRGPRHSIKKLVFKHLCSQKGQGWWTMQSSLEHLNILISYFSFYCYCYPFT